MLVFIKNILLIYYYQKCRSAFRAPVPSGIITQQKFTVILRNAGGGAGVRWTPLPEAEAPTEPTGENVPYIHYSARFLMTRTPKGRPYNCCMLHFRYSWAHGMRPYNCLMLHFRAMRNAGGGAGVRWTPLPEAEAPTEPTGENVPYIHYSARF